MIVSYEGSKNKLVCSYVPTETWKMFLLVPKTVSQSLLSYDEYLHSPSCPSVLFPSPIPSHTLSSALKDEHISIFLPFFLIPVVISSLSIFSHFASLNSLGSRFPLFSDRTWTLLQAWLYEMIFSAASSWQSIALMILHAKQIKSLEHKWPVLQNKPYVTAIILHTLAFPYCRVHIQQAIQRLCIDRDK